LTEDPLAEKCAACRVTLLPMARYCHRCGMGISGDIAPSAAQAVGNVAIFILLIIFAGFLFALGSCANEGSGDHTFGPILYALGGLFAAYGIYRLLLGFRS
jgi:hypothetical protein